MGQVLHRRHRKDFDVLLQYLIFWVGPCLDRLDNLDIEEVHLSVLFSQSPWEQLFRDREDLPLVCVWEGHLVDQLGVEEVKYHYEVVVKQLFERQGNRHLVDNQGHLHARIFHDPVVGGVNSHLGQTWWVVFVVCGEERR